NTIIAFAVAIIGLLSTLSILQTNRSRNLLKEQMITKIESELTIAKSDLKQIFEELIEKKYKEIDSNIDKKVNLGLKINRENLVNIESQLEKSTEQIDKTEEYLLNVEYDALNSKIISKNYSYDNTLKRTLKLLKDAKKRNNETLMTDVINLLTYAYYDNGKDNEITNLLTKYENKAPILSTSYGNAALIGFNNYHNFNSKTQRDNAIHYLDKSLELAQGYGFAQAVKLEIFMMDYLRSKDDTIKNEAINNCTKVFDVLLQSESGDPAYLTITRLDGDAENQHFKKYVDKLNELFNDEIIELRKKAGTYKV
ncbi:MAG: hypothetical protein KUG68_04505, partial [Flavobacteriaceae bacterium]|nr:hypothetical protein [Flavobacteriaceae bacterium]